MPAEDDTRAKILDVYVSKEWLLKELRVDESRIIVLDCRTPKEYGESHIRKAVNFIVSPLLLRRLGSGKKMNLASTIKSGDLKSRIENADRNIFVVYGARIEERTTTPSNDIVHSLIRALREVECDAVCLQDGFTEFRRAYPEWCEDSNIAASAAGIRDLWIGSPQGTPTSSTDESSPESERIDASAPLGYDEDRDFPVEIVPYLYLGNAANSEDLEALRTHGIGYILNVTSDLPNKFETTTNMKYMQIPVTDHGTEDLACHFKRAIRFIDEGRSKNIGVLVHCLAGVSRSPTITVAYLMDHMKLSMNEAFSLVRARRANVGPNVHFLVQLNAFERELAASTTATTNTAMQRRSGQSSTDSADGTSDESAISSASTVFGQSPDSGIEFDRWTPGAGE